MMSSIYFPSVLYHRSAIVIHDLIWNKAGSKNKQGTRPYERDHGLIKAVVVEMPWQEGRRELQLNAFNLQPLHHQHTLLGAGW